MNEDDLFMSMVKHLFLVLCPQSIWHDMFIVHIVVRVLQLGIFPILADLQLFVAQIKSLIQVLSLALLL